MKRMRVYLIIMTILTTTVCFGQSSLAPKCNLATCTAPLCTTISGINTTEGGGFDLSEYSGFTYSCNGDRLKTVYTWENGEENGEFFVFHYNGQLKLHGFYLDGLEDGEWHEFDDKGNLLKHHFYKRGFHIGSYLEYWGESIGCNQLKASGKYDRDKKVGEWRYFNSCGGWKCTITYNNEGQETKCTGDCN